MVNKEPGAYWTDSEIKESISDWKKRRPEKLKTQDWEVKDVPFYEKGKLPRVDLWHRVDFLDELEITWGKPWGASGLGKLKEAVLVRPSEDDFNILEKQDPIFMNRPVVADIKKWQQEHANLAQCLENNGVKVHYLEYPSPAIGPYGPMRGMWAGHEVLVVWGGAIIPRYGCWNPLCKGRERVLTEWLAKMGCPILCTIIGKGVCEPAFIWVADDCVLVGRGMAFNEDGINQIRPVLERVGITTILEVHHTGWSEYMRKGEGYGAYHPDGFINVIAPGKVLLCSKFCDWEIIKWFRDNHFDLIEIDPDEQTESVPANLIVLEPGKIIMHAEAKETIKKVKKVGIEVIEVPYKENLIMGGGIDCATGQLVRDRGPTLADILS